jgi:putative ABC transport system substrate-binding protein
MVLEEVDIIVAGAEVIAKAAAQATVTIPIILIAWDYDPVASGLVRSLNKPGGNVTGVYMRVVETVSKRLEVLREIMPGLSRVAILYDHYGKRQLPDTAPAAAALGLSVVPIEVREPYDFLAALKQAKTRKVGAVSVLFSPIFYVERQRLTDAARTLQLPTMFQEYGSVQAGGLVSYGPSPTDGWYRAAYFIDRILKGSKPGELPIERPDVYYLAVNMRTANALGIAIPESVRLRADEIIR